MLVQCAQGHKPPQIGSLKPRKLSATDPANCVPTLAMTKRADVEPSMLFVAENG